jgi:hypothetical protein
MKKNILETTTQFLFITFMFVVVIIVSLGLTLDFERIKTVSFWIETALQFIMSMTVFNTIYGLSKRNKIHDTSGRFYKAYATNRLRIKHLEENKMYKQLDEACEKENKERLIKKCNDKLYRICSRICYDDVIGETPIEELITFYKVAENKHLFFSKYRNNFQKHKFEKLVKKIRNGNIRIKPVKSVSFLQDRENYSKHYDNYDLNVYVENLERNTKKAFTFLLSSFVIAIIGFSFYSPNFLKTLLTNITLILSACVSGFRHANETVRFHTALYEHRNSFLHKHLDIKIEYKEETTV